jgi:hypothetical protein
MEFDGNLISELGVKRYMKGHEASQFSNINPLKSSLTKNKQWQECNFGCHGPSYRTLQHQLTYSEFLNHLDKLSPLVAGAVDGVRHETIQTAKVVTSGIQRTGEGLGVSGKEVFSQVGEENLAAYHFVKVNVTNLINADLNLADNPITQLIFTIVHEYVNLLPDSMLKKMVEDRAIIIPDDIDKNFVVSAARYAAIEIISSEHIDQAIQFISTKGQRFIGKQVGKKVTRAVAAIIAAKITKKIISGSSNSIKRKISRLKKSFKPATGNMGTALIILLKTNGWLGVAAEESRKLQADSPALWKILRYKLGGFDMLMFLISGFVKEYVDRISILEKNPDVYFKLMVALVKSGRTQEIFFPR